MGIGVEYKEKFYLNIRNENNKAHKLAMTYQGQITQHLPLLIREDICVQMPRFLLPDGSITGRKI